MASENMVTVVGGLGRDPELRYTQGGRAVASFGLAVSRRYQVNGEWQEDTSWINVTVWGDLAENCAASLTKGARVMVAGRFQQREFETKEGEKRNVIELVADEVGPSLRWAQAQVERISRDSANAGGFSGGGSSGGAPKPASDPIYGDEEPF
jgi:single-strand DNA-binding protein